LTPDIEKDKREIETDEERETHTHTRERDTHIHTRERHPKDINIQTNIECVYTCENEREKKE